MDTELTELMKCLVARDLKIISQKANVVIDSEENNNIIQIVLILENAKNRIEAMIKKDHIAAKIKD